MRENTQYFALCVSIAGNFLMYCSSCIHFAAHDKIAVVLAEWAVLHGWLPYSLREFMSCEHLHRVHIFALFSRGLVVHGLIMCIPLINLKKIF